MKFNKLILIALISIFLCFLLTACRNDTSYINDQTGKVIPVTTSDSDTYTFKLPASQIEESEPPSSDDVATTEIAEETEIADNAVETEISEENTDSKGPKTGEP